MKIPKNKKGRKMKDKIHPSHPAPPANKKKYLEWLLKLSKPGEEVDKNHYPSRKKNHKSKLKTTKNEFLLLYEAKTKKKYAH